MRTYLACALFLVAAACGSDSTRTANPDGGGGGSGSGSGSGGSGLACGGLAGARCEPTEFCDYANNTCGAADESGTCKARPTLCPLAAPDIAGEVVCGCDGKVYSAECTANSGGTDLNANGGCPLEPNRFACGYLQCDLATQYCVHDTKSTTPETAYACAMLPQACGANAACGCLSGVQCGTDCAGDSKAGLTVTCQ